MPDPTHRRGRVVHDGVLDATLALIAERGYAFAVEDVAELAGVHKTTVYRRWPTKARLVADALTRTAQQQVPTPAQQDDPLTALRTLAVQVAQAVATPVGTRSLRAVAAVTGDDPDLATAAAAFFDARYTLATDLIRRAQEQGTLRPDVDPLLVWEAIVNPLHMRALLGRPTTTRTAQQLCDLALDGCREK